MSETTANVNESTKGGGTEADSAPVADTPKLRKAIQEAAKKIAGLRADRTEINAGIQEALESLNAQGIPKDALKRAIADVDLEESNRIALDTAYELARVALGKPVQRDLFASNTTH